MQSADQPAIIENAIAIVAEMSPQSTDGTWLDDVTVAVGPHVKEWDVARCYLWSEWPDRETHFPGTTNQDIGIDCVAIRRSDREYVAIQCKSRQLNAAGQGAPISKGEIDSFASTSAGEFWAERWIVTNGDNPVSGNSQQAMSMTDKPVKMVSIANDLLQQQAAFTYEECLNNEPHVRGLGYGKYADAAEIEPADRERFRELADQWEIETVLLSNSNQAAKHPAHQEIISMSEPVVPLILERMQSQGGHWFHALREITNANPVQPDDRGNVGAMKAAWLQWGEDKGYV